MKRMKTKFLAASLLIIVGVTFAIFFTLDQEEGSAKEAVMEKDPLEVGSSLIRKEKEGLDMEGVMGDMDQIWEYYEAGENEKARAVFRKVNQKVFGESDCAGMEYPTSVTLNLKILDKLLKDREGYFDRLSTFTGIAKGIYIGNTGLFQVKGKKDTMDFVYERDVLILPDEDFHGRRVTVYFDKPGLFDSYTALKIVVHPQGFSRGGR